MKLFRLPLNLNQILIHTGQEDVTNTVVAFIDKFKQVIVIRPTFQDSIKLVREFAIMYIDDNAAEFEVVLGDGFEVDTWDKKAQTL